MTTTVAIPLFQSERWRDVVAGNIERLAGRVHLSISDVQEDDDTLASLRREYAQLPGIQWTGRRDLPPGFVAHCNDLLARSNAELFMWLPHDDEIGPDWTTSALDVLAARPDAILAYGTLRSIDEGRGVIPKASLLAPDDKLSDPVRERRLERALKHCFYGTAGYLGLAFRGVFRRDRARPLPAAVAGDEYADLLWTLAMLARGPFVKTDASYWKRWHADNTHGGWSNLRRSAAFNAAHLAAALSDLPPDERLRLYATARPSKGEYLRAGARRVRRGGQRRLHARLRRARRSAQRHRPYPH
jgi:hypothetical protein